MSVVATPTAMTPAIAASAPPSLCAEAAECLAVARIVDVLARVVAPLLAKVAPPNDSCAIDTATMSRLSAGGVPVAAVKAAPSSLKVAVPAATVK